MEAELAAFGQIILKEDENMKIKKQLFLALLAMAAVSCGSSKMKEDGNAFMQAMQAQDAEKSFAMLTPSVQKEVGEIEGWTKFMSARKPTSWSFDGFSVNANGTGELPGSVDFEGQGKYDMKLVFAKAGEDWKVSGIHFDKAK
jgi:hypothetical protein